MSESFGTRLRTHREAQNIALTTIAERTKIKLSLLEELERDDVSHWPTGIFRRAFIRDYARAIGFDQDAVVREFVELYPDPVEVAETAATDDAAATSGRAPTRFGFLVSSAIDSISRFWNAAAPQPQVSAERVDRETTDAIDTIVPEAVQVVPPPEPLRAAEPPAPDIDLAAVARLCTEFGQLDTTAQAPPLLAELSTMIDAAGLVVWMWDPAIRELRAAAAHGYPDRLLAQLPRVKRDADNATAAAFRSSETCVVRGSDQANGAITVPLLSPIGCVGVLAVELNHGREQQPTVRDLTAIFAAQLARVIATAQPSVAAGRMLA